MAINERLIHTAEEAAAPSGGGTGNQEEGLILHLDANDVDSYDGDGSVWYDITNHEYTPAVDPAENFNTVTYSGASSAQSITGVGFQPDMVWIKSRNLTNNHVLIDSLRGLNGGSTYENLYPNLTNAEANDNAVNSLDSDGFSLVNTQQNANHSSYTYVAWCFKAGGAAVANTDGDINSNVSVNNDLGFSIVSYTGNSGTGQTVGHGMDVPPELIIAKRRNADRDWRVYAKPLGATKYMDLNENGAAGTFGSWNNTHPTATVFSTSNGTDTATNNNGDTYVAYCFASKRGVSKVGSYTGTGSAGNKVYTGFEPAWVLFKETGASGQSWNICDNARGAGKRLYADLNSVENTTSMMDFNADGFTFTGTGNGYNGSGKSYLFLAFAAEKPDSLIDDTDLELHLDAGDTDSYDPSSDGSTWSDLTAGNHNVALTSMNASQHNKELGGWFEFDGSNDYGTASYNGDLYMTSNTGFAIEAWVNRDGTSEGYIIASADNSTYPYALTWNGNTHGYYGWISGSGFSNSARAGLNNNTSNGVGKWDHVVLTQSSSDRRNRLYINGELTSTSSAVSGFHSTSSNVHIGAYHNLADKWNGKIGQLRIYKQELSADEVMQNYRFTKSDYPNGYNADLSNLTFDPNGYFNYNSTSDSAIIPNSYYLLPRANAERTYLVWAKIDSVTNHNTFLKGADSSNSDSSFYFRQTNSSGLNLAIYDEGQNRDINGYTGGALSANTWYLIGFRVSASGTARVHRISTGVSTFADASGTMGDFETDSTMRLQIGWNQSGYGLDGDIGQVRVYDRYLTDAEITAHYDEYKSDYGLS